MNRKLKYGLIIIVILIVGSVTVFAAGSSPGTIDDPVVTKSYVDEQIAKITKTGGTTGTGGAVEIIVEELKVGDIIIAGAGTEVILRGGHAVAYGDGTNGIPDLTAGNDLAIGRAVTANHLLIFPRDDGRGIKITKGPAFVMIRGAYSITK